jgi:uncharacterized protein (DUF3084 family)
VKVKSFSAGMEFVRIVLEDGTFVQFKQGDDWEGPTSELDDMERQLEQARIDRADERRMRIRAEQQAVKLAVGVEDVEKRLDAEREERLAAQRKLAELLRPGQDCPTMLTEVFARVLRLIRATAEGAICLADREEIVGCCNALLEE